MKTCKKCGSQKPLDDFPGTGYFGKKGARCRKCVNEAVKKYRAAHLEQENKRRSTYYQQHGGRGNGGKSAGKYG